MTTTRRRLAADPLRYTCPRGHPSLQTRLFREKRPCYCSECDDFYAPEDLFDERQHARDYEPPW